MSVIIHEAVVEAIEQHLRDARVLFANNPRLRHWISAIEADAVELVDSYVLGQISRRTYQRTRLSLARQAELISQYVSVQNKKQLEQTFRAVLLATIRVAVKIAL